MTTTAVGSGQLFPQGGWDAHHHIYEPEYSYASDRHLTPTPATIADFLAFRSRIGASHSVLTHGLCYGSNCSSLVAVLQRLGTSTAKGIGVIDPDTTSDQEIVRMHNAGVRGIRVNLYKYGAMHNSKLQEELLRKHAIRLKDFPGWTMAFTQLHPEFWEALRPTIISDVAGRGVRLVTDHFGLLKGRSMLPAECEDDIERQPGFAAIVSLMQDGLLWVKLSAPYRVSEMSPGYEDLEPLVRALASANPRRILWGSDWPHTPQMKVRAKEEAMVEVPNLDIDDIAWLKNLKHWLSDQEWDWIMRANPNELYNW